MVDELPAIVKENPAIEHFVVNLIDTNHGIQIPALLHSLIETFNRDGIDQSIFSDRDFLNWINQKLIGKNQTNNDISTQIGRGVGTHIEQQNNSRDSNKDPFALLMPDKGVF